MSRVANYLDVKRKHFRFPAYDDAEGVKLESEHKPAFSQENDWILTEIKDTPSRPKPEKEIIERKVPSSQRNRGHNVQQKEELAQHRANLPRYEKRPVKEQQPTGKTNFFGSQTKRSSYQVTSKEAKAEPMTTPKKEYSGRSYFVPKYIPASIIPDEPKPEVSQNDLLDSMAKPQESYLLFDQEPAAYQVKEANDPTVKKFNRPQGVGMTRSQYRAVSKKTGEKKGLLDRTLQGMIEDDKMDDEKNGYFRP